MPGKLDHLPGVIHTQLDVQAATAREAIEQVMQLLANDPGVTDLPQFRQKILEREELSSTSMGHGVAFPHARTDLVRDIVLAIGRSREGVPFGPEKTPTHLIFVIGVPHARIAEYLALVGSLARLLKQPQIREELMRAETPGEFLAPLR